MTTTTILPSAHLPATLLSQVRRTIEAAAERFLTPRAATPVQPPFAGALLQNFETRHGRVAAWIGQGGGPTVLTVHGWQGATSQFSGLYDRLLARGMRIVAFALPAHPPSEGSWTSVRHSAEALADFGRAHGRVDAVIAHSVGAAVVTHALAAGMQAEAAILLACPDNYGQHARGYARKLGFGDEQSEAMVRVLNDRWGVDVDDASSARAASRLAQRALLIHGDEDRVVPWSDSWRVASQWPTSRMALMPGLDHVTILDDGEVIDLAMQFLEMRGAEGAAA